MSSGRDYLENARKLDEFRAREIADGEGPSLVRGEMTDDGMNEASRRDAEPQREGVLNDE
jgi:hypothetical protein